TAETAADGLHFGRSSGRSSLHSPHDSRHTPPPSILWIMRMNETPSVAVEALLRVEKIPHRIWECAAGPDARPCAILVFRALLRSGGCGTMRHGTWLPLPVRFRISPRYDEDEQDQGGVGDDAAGDCRRVPADASIGW